MRKRDSRRRWKARFKIGRPVPEFAVVEHQITPPLDWVKSPLREYWMPLWRMAIEYGISLEAMVE